MSPVSPALELPQELPAPALPPLLPSNMGAQNSKVTGWRDKGTSQEGDFSCSAGALRHKNVFNMILVLVVPVLFINGDLFHL